VPRRLTTALLAVGLLTLVPTPMPAADGPASAETPIVFPDDEAPHQSRSEWWYYTGHLHGPDGATYGFELTFFQSFLQDGTPGYVGHFAVTDTPHDTFRFAQRIAVGPQPSSNPGFDLAIGTWSMRGALGHDALRADMPGYAIDLRLEAMRPPTLQGGGYVKFGPAGDSYYYSRTRMRVQGSLAVGDDSLDVDGLAWMDHQWGDFRYEPAQGGWDWFGAQLDDGSDLMAILLRDATGAVVGGYGTFVTPDDRPLHLDLADLQAEPTASWTSPATGITYPSGWQLSVPRLDLRLSLSPSLPAQELDTRLTTGVVYWEGQTRIAGSRAGSPVAGLGYTELTGYQPPPATAAPAPRP
jgi:predicted secreted hydrolase